MSAHELAPPLPRTARLLSHQWAALAVVLTGTFMVVLDFFIVNVAMPAMQSDLHAGTGAIEWVVAGYGLTFATFLITAGRLGDQLGRRRMFSLGLALFTLASAACGLAPSPAVLVVARLVQGLAAALLSPQVLSIIGVVYTGPDRVRAISIYGIVLGLAAVGGQLIGGVLVQADIAGLGWRSCFLINVPIGLIALAIAARAVPESRVEGAHRLDLVGTALITLGLVDIVLPLVEGRQHGWPAWTWLCLGAAPITLGLFAAHQRRLSRRGGAPLLDPALFRERAFSAGLVTQLVFFSSMASYFLVLALYLQNGRGLGALSSGAVFTLVAVPYMVGTGVQRRLAARLGRWTVPVGAGLFTLGHLALLVAVAENGAGGPLVDLVPGLALAGFGMGVALTALIDAAMGGVEPEYAGAVSGVLSTAQQVGNALGVAVVGMVFFGAVHGGYDHALEWSLVVLVGTTAAVALLGALLQPRRTGDRADQQIETPALAG
jgi:EmrB/QacA subfamily drug resistance transporter